MVGTVRPAIGFLAVFLAVSLASRLATAQTTGTVIINGSVTSFIRLVYWDDAMANDTAGDNGPGFHDAPLGYTMDMGDVGPNNVFTYEGGTVQLGLRSSAARYTLSAAVTAHSGIGGAGQPALTDFGFGIPHTTNKVMGGIKCSGALCNPAAKVAPVAPFDNNPLAASISGVTGLPSFAATLNDVATQTAVLTANQVISTGGGLTTATNALLVPTTFALHPQAWVPTAGFSVTVTFTLSST